MRAPVKAAYVVRFFQLVTARQLTEAERELQRIKEKIERTEWNHGYYRALHGMLLSKRHNNDQTTFLSTIDPTDKRAILDFRREFQEKMESRLYTDYDRGFFSAWADYMSVLKRMNLQEKISPLPQSSSRPNTAVVDRSPQAQASLTEWQGKKIEAA
jgi:viroplasmin and RNaseH domain-containing protein